MKLRVFSATVVHRDREGHEREESFPVRAWEYDAAHEMALAYVLQVLKLKEFELRIVGG